MSTLLAQPLAILFAKSLVISVLFLGGSTLLRYSSSATLRLWWRAAIVSLLAATASLAVPPVWYVATRPSTAVQEVPSVSLDLRTANNPAPVEISSADATVPTSKQTDHFVPSVVQIFAGVWAIGTAVLLIGLLVSTIRVAGILRRAKLLTDLEFGEPYAGIQHLNNPRAIRLSVSSEVQSPFVAGLFRSVIVVPQQWIEWSDEQRRIVLMHEVAHVGSRDVLWQALAEVAVALHWANPFVWLVRAKIRKAQEGAADDAVLLAGVDRLDYATLLADIAAHSRSLPVAPMARQSTLRWRVARMLNTSQRRGPVAWLTRGGTLVWTTAMILLLGFTGIGAEKSALNSGEPNASGESGQLRWARKFRDTFVLNQSFAEQFRGTPEEAVAAVRNELSKLAGEPVDDVILTLSTDKRTLVVEYSEKRAKKVEPTVLRLLVKTGWWDDMVKERQQAADRALEPFREEVVKQRLHVEACAVEATQLREEAGIIDPDLENPTSILAHSENSEGKQTLEQKTKTNNYTNAKAKYIQAKKILEAAELRFSTAAMEIGIGDLRE